LQSSWDATHDEGIGDTPVRTSVFLRSEKGGKLKTYLVLFWLTEGMCRGITGAELLCEARDALCDAFGGFKFGGPEGTGDKRTCSLVNLVFLKRSISMSGLSQNVYSYSSRNFS